MLRITSESEGGLCDGVSRRDFLRVGSLGLGGLSLPWLFQQGAQAAPLRAYDRGKSIIFLFLCGGPSQIETFDPNMSAPAPRHSVTGEVKTSIPGVTFGGTFPKMAALANRLAVVRSYAPHGISDHAKAIWHTFKGGNPLGKEYSLGAIHSRLLNQSLAPGGVPTNVALIENEVDSQYKEDMVRMRAGNTPGRMGAPYAAFDPLGKGKLKEDMTLNLPLERLNDRRALHGALDRLNRKMDAGGIEATDAFNRKAVEVVLGGAARQALDLSNEDPRIVERYDTGAYQTGWTRKRKSTLGRRLLMARRLVEAGARYVTVGMAGWDNHGNGKHPGVLRGMHLLGTPLDHAVSAYLEDVHRRGLDDKVLLVITGEFGRTPKMEAKGGRNHWPGLCPLVLAGGGFQMGQVIGKSRKTADAPDTEPIRLENLVSTLLHTMFDLGKMRLDPAVPKELLGLVEAHKPIQELL